MQIIVLGLNYKTTPIKVRERLAFSKDDTAQALAALKDKFDDCEFVILSTCNRVELYCAAGGLQGPSVEDLIAFLSLSRNIRTEEFQEFLYTRFDSEAVGHLLTVSSSLDSMVLGESQIIAQVKESYAIACTVKSTGKVLNKLFHYAFTTSKKIYSDTSIASRRVSVAGVAVDLAKQLFADISSAEILVIGAGQMGELLVEHFLHEKCDDITIVNRSSQRGLDLAKAHNIVADNWDKMGDHLLTANIVVASAGGQDYLFTKESLKKAIHKRRAGPLLIIDIAVPRNFEPAVNEIDDVYLYSIDDLAHVAEQNSKLRQDEIDQAVEIICDKVAEFMDWFSLRDVGPLVGQMKESFDRISRNEMTRFFVGKREEASCRDVMEAMVTRVVHKLLHCVITNVNMVGKEHGPDAAAKLVSNIANHAEEIANESNSKSDE